MKRMGRGCTCVCVCLYFSIAHNNTRKMEYLRLSPCSLPSPPWHRSVCPKYDPSPSFLLEVPPSRSPCLSHISQPQLPPSYERGSLGFGTHFALQDQGAQPFGKETRKGSQPTHSPPSPTTSRAVGQTPPVSSKEKHSCFPRFPLPSTALHRLASLLHRHPGNMQLEQGGRGERSF